MYQSGVKILESFHWRTVSSFNFYFKKMASDRIEVHSGSLCSQDFKSTLTAVKYRITSISSSFEIIFFFLLVMAATKNQTQSPTQETQVSAALEGMRSQKRRRRKNSSALGQVC